MKINGWVIVIFGIWIVISALIGFSAVFIFWSNLISGIIVGIAGFTMAKAEPGFGWIAGILGIWMIVSAFIPSLLTGSGLLWDNIISGAIIAFDGFGASAKTRPATAPAQ